MTPDAFIQLVLDWNQTHEHKENTIPDIVWNGEHSIRYGNDKLYLAFQEYIEEQIIAARHEKQDEAGVVWKTDYIMNFRDMLLAIQLDRSYQGDIPTINKNFSTPHIITILANKGFLKPDGILPVCREPILIEENNIKLLSDIICGKSQYRLPVVYVSKTVYNQTPVAEDWLASRLKGVAHILVQADVRLNTTLKNLCNSKNEYYGEIGIYYPGDNSKHISFSYNRYEGKDSQLLEKIIKNVIRFSNTQNIAPLYTWQGVSNALLRERLDRQREAGELIEAFDEEQRKLRQQIEELTHANEVLTYENQGLRAKLSASDSVPLLFFSEEEEFFQDEIKDLVLETLTDALIETPKSSRRHDILQDLFEKNKYMHLLAMRRNKLKEILKNYDRLSNSIRQALKELGIEITDDGKHYKLVYYGDKRYCETMAKTPSDSRCGAKNLISGIINKML